MKKMTQDDVLKDLRAEVNETSMRKTAKRIGVSVPYISDVLRGNRAVSEKVAAAFGFEREIITEVIFRKIA